MKFSYLLLRTKQALKIFAEVKNPISSFLFYMGFKDSITVKTRKLGPFTFNSTQKKLYNSLLLVLPYLDDSDKEECKLFYEKSVSNSPVVPLKDYEVANKECWIFSEKFAEYPYNFKSVNRDDIIIDIGANVGDTALDFASKGLIVYGFEPVRELYKIALENVALNKKFENRIHIFNYAVSNRNGTITIDAMDSTSEYVNDDDCYEVEVITLEDIMNDNGIAPKLLKMDCEGCEFEIIKNTDLSMFDEIIFEHHASFKEDSYDVLVDELKRQGFKIDLIPLWSFKMEDIGIIHAYK